MRHKSESLGRAIAVALVLIVAAVLGLSFVGYAGERIVALSHRAAP